MSVGIANQTVTATRAITTDRTARPRRPRGSVKGIPLTILGIVFLAIMVFPVYWMVNTSLQATSGAATATWFPWSPTFAGYQAAIAARLAVPRISDAQRDHVVRLVAAMHASLEHPETTSDARWAVFSYLGDRSGNAQHRTLMEDASMVLFRNLRDWVVPVTDRARMRDVYIAFAGAVRDGDGDEAERLVRTMYYL